MRVDELDGNTEIADVDSELPHGWTKARLQDVAAINPSTSFDELDTDDEIAFVPMAAVAEESGQIDFSQRRKVSAVSKGYVRFMEGDVIFAKITPCMENGKVAPVSGAPGKFVAGSTEFHVIRPHSADQRYLWYWLVSRSFRHQAQRNMSGSAGQLRVPVDFLRNAELPIPPIAEQKRIVARIDALFAEIAEGEAALAQARQGLETFRRALLKSAVTGELTEDWRRVNMQSRNSSDIVISAILERAFDEEFSTAPRRRKRASASVLREVYALPRGWQWTRLGDIGDVTGGLTKNQDRAKLPTKAPYLRVANVQMGSLDLAEVKEIGVTWNDIDRASLEDGDLLIVEGNGSIDQIGRCAIWRGEISGCVHQNHIIKVRFNHSLLSSWCLHWLQSPLGRTEIEKVAASTSGLHTLSISKIQALPVPVPPAAEIEEIIRGIDEGLAAYFDTGSTLNMETGDAARLMQAILKSAFEGRLVEQDAADEPAKFPPAREPSPSAPVSTTARDRKPRVAKATA